MAQSNPSKYISLKIVSSRTDLSISTLRRLEIAGQFPRRHRISPRRVGWLVQDIDAWIESKSNQS